MERYDWGENLKPGSGVPDSSPRIRQPPMSPVKVNFQPEDWARPSAGTIETHIPHAGPIPAPVYERPLPKSPEAPTPPPHTPQQYGAEQRQCQAYQPYNPQQQPWQQHSQPQQPSQIPAAAQNYVPGAENSLSPTTAVTPASNGVRAPQPNGPVKRNSRESDSTESTSQQPTSAESSATTSDSSMSGVLDCADNQDNKSADASIESVPIDENAPPPEPVQPLQYHHQAFLPRPPSLTDQDPRAQSSSNLETGAAVNRHLTPNAKYMRRSSLPRPQSAYSVTSEYGVRGRSPNLYGNSQYRSPSSTRRSPDVRPSSYVELLSMPYPQQAPAPISMDNSQLRSVVGSNASLLSTEKTLEMYRQNVKKTNDFATLYSFAVFLIATAQEMGFDPAEPHKQQRTKSPKPDGGSNGATSSSPYDLVREARAILQKLSNNGYPFAQYYLADGYASGLFSKGKEDYNSAFPLFVLAAKHGHAESAYRTALCYEFGWGCRKDPAKAVQFLRSAASKRHPGAMTRLGVACLSGDLGEKRYREGIKWLKLAAEAADSIYNAAPYHLGCLYEHGYGDDIFQDESYAAELFTQAAQLGHPEANYRMGDAYEHGKLNCPRDPALSVHFYTGAAERGHPAAMMGLCAWYMVGAEPVLERDEEEAYEWARRAAELGMFFFFFFFFSSLCLDSDTRDTNWCLITH